VKPWLDVEDLLPGEDWEVEIPKALFASDIILVCLSKNSINKEGYVQKEIAFALDKALEKPEGTIFIIPVKLEDCELPKRLSRYQAVDLFRTDGRKRLLMGLNKRIANLGDEVLPIKIDETKQRTPKPIKPEPKPEEKLVTPQPEKKAETPFAGEKKEQPKPFTRVLNPASLNPQKKSEPKEPKQNYNTRRLFVGGIILIAILGILFAGNYLLNKVPINETPLPTPKINSSMVSENDGMTLMFVQAGEFTMGSENSDDERPIHQVHLDAYWIDQTEVTNAMYANCVDANQCNPPRIISSYTNSSYFDNSEFEDYPVIYVSWNDAKDYCEYAGRRLPTEAEWEKAARGKDGNVYPWGKTFDGKLVNYCDSNCSFNHADNSFNDGYEDVAPVGSYPLGTSIYGALDMAGNVWEWVNDWYGDNYYQSSPSFNPQGPSSGEYRVLRGGSWYDYSYIVRSALRKGYSPSATVFNFGFRCAMDADQ